MDGETERHTCGSTTYMVTTDRGDWKYIDIIYTKVLKSVTWGDCRQNILMPSRN